MYIKTANGKMFFDIPVTSTLDCLREGIALQEGIPIEEQRWIFQGKQLSNGALPLQDYNIRIEHTLLLLHQTNLDKVLPIYIKTFRGEFSTKLSVRIMSSVQVLIRILQERFPFLPKKLQLSFNGQIFENENATILDYGITEESVIYIVPKIFLHIENSSGKKLKMNINENDPNMTRNIVEKIFSKYEKNSSKSSKLPSSLLIKRTRQQMEEEYQQKEERTSLSCEQNSTSMFSGLKRGFLLNREEKEVPSLIINASKKLKTELLSKEETSRCFKCNKKTGLVGIKCRCGSLFLCPPQIC